MCSTACLVTSSYTFSMSCSMSPMFSRTMSRNLCFFFCSFSSSFLGFSGEVGKFWPRLATELNMRAEEVWGMRMVLREDRLAVPFLTVFSLCAGLLVESLSRLFCRAESSLAWRWGNTEMRFPKSFMVSSLLFVDDLSSPSHSNSCLMFSSEQASLMMWSTRFTELETTKLSVSAWISLCPISCTSKSRWAGVSPHCSLFAYS
mmetsp:Transcript_11786/g.19896  ORF Transcript_11786/g.19896 Transcript_11786/m.19896 type:complete len:203 (+) Transcript_11786:640-1248(+)